MKKSATTQCAKAVSLFRGLYARVARKLGVDVSYVSRIARGERKSKVAEKALTKEFNKVVSVMRNGSSAPSCKKFYVVVTLVCPRCKTQQRVHIAARVGFGQPNGERVSCIKCDNHFKVTIPDTIIRGPFPA
jgi:transcriptional regulator with XRE-family HTH domain